MRLSNYTHSIILKEMKLLKILCIALCLTGMAACSGSSSYSPEKCTQLSEKIKSGDTLSEKDYSEIVDQFAAATELFVKKQQEFGDDKAKMSEYLSSDEGKQLVGNVLGFGIYLDQNADKLSASDVKKMEKTKELVENQKKK